jgi:hypothetical protein
MAEGDEKNKAGAALPSEGGGAQEEEPEPERTTVEVELMGGHTDGRGKVHKHVVFGRRITGRDLFAIDSDPQAELKTQYQLLLFRASIVEFGTMETRTKKGDWKPVALTALLALNTLDIDELQRGFNEYLTLGIAEEDVEEPQAGLDYVRLLFGFDVNGVQYRRVQFGKHITGMDQVQAEKLGLQGYARVCYLAGKEIVKVSSDDGAEMDGPVGMDMFEGLDMRDIMLLRTAREFWRQSFRIGRG